MLRGGRVALALVLAAAFAWATAAVVAPRVLGGAEDDMPRAPGNGTCGTCHEGLEDMHPSSPVTCVQCHGGDATQGDMTKAHVTPRSRVPGDERTLGQSFDPEYLRFRDPGDLRAAPTSCGPCHQRAVYDVRHSLHASTAGHLGDGLYENGVVDRKGPAFSVFPVRDELPPDLERPEGAVPFLKQIPGFRTGGDPMRVSTHFTDLPRKTCMQCHLWSRGRAVRGRAGMDGDYRGEGCSACHVPYADDGLSLSRDRTIDKYEPGHPKEHRMVRFPETSTCTRCHYGDASIGLSFRGLAQPVPGMPQSPDAPGLHRKRLNGVYYIDDPASTPADVHHQRGMHCVDCHTRNDTMGDGFLYTRMEDATEIQCQSCHGDWTAYATGLTRKGSRLPHLEMTDGKVFLKSRVTGKRHRVKQARDVVRPGSDDFNASAAMAMTGDHGNLECYTCHSGWNPNFFGFHFDRNEAFTQLDVLSGNRTTGRVTTQEKVFSTFKHFYLGWNSHGRIAPYMVGFSSMATVHDDENELLLDQALPTTRAGLSGMTMIHHQTHTTTARARECVECHRSPTTYGRGSVNFRLTRDFMYAVGNQGVRAISLDRKNPGNSALLASIAIEEARTVAIDLDKTTGYAKTLFVGSRVEGLIAVSCTIPGFPRVISREKDAFDDPRRMLFADGTLYVAEGLDGVRVFDVGNPSRPREIAHVADFPAFDLHLDGTTLYVAAGTKGLIALDVRTPSEPTSVSAGFDLNGGSTTTVDVRNVSLLFQYSRPNAEQTEKRRTRARNLAVVGTLRRGLWLVDLTEPKRPSVIMQVGNGLVSDVAMGTIYELGSEGGAIPTQERDFVFAINNNALALVDVTDPTAPQFKGAVGIAAGARSLRVARIYNPPFLQTMVIVTGNAGVQIIDVTRPTKPEIVATLNTAIESFDLALEEFPLDRTVDSTGAPIMDVSHADARWLSQAEFLRVMSVPVLDFALPPPRRKTGDDR